MLTFCNSNEYNSESLIKTMFHFFVDPLKWHRLTSWNWKAHFIFAILCSPGKLKFYFFGSKSHSDSNCSLIQKIKNFNFPGLQMMLFHFKGPTQKSIDCTYLKFERFIEDRIERFPMNFCLIFSFSFWQEVKFYIWIWKAPYVHGREFFGFGDVDS